MSAVFSKPWPNYETRGSIVWMRTTPASTWRDRVVVWRFNAWQWITHPTIDVVFRPADVVDLPWGYGIAWLYYDRFAYRAAWIPLNLVLGWWRSFAIEVRMPRKVGAVERELYDTYRKGRADERASHFGTDTIKAIQMSVDEIKKRWPDRRGEEN